MDQKCPKCGSPLGELVETKTGRKLQRCSTGSRLLQKDELQNEEIAITS